MWLAPTTTTTTSLLLRRFNKSVSSKSCRAALLLIHPNSSSSSKFGGGGTFILHQQANNHHTTTFFPSSSSSKFGTIILQTNEPSVGSRGEKKDDIKMFMLSSSGSGDGTTGEEEDKYDDDDDDQNKKKMVFKLDEDLGFSALYKDFQLQDSLRMVGSCNGIICLHDPKVKWLRDIYLWNPATRHFRILPASIHIEEQHSEAFDALKDFVGFGFDVETDDYKVLRISPFVPHSSNNRGSDGCMCRVQIYNLSTNSWRLLNGIDSLPAVSPTQDLFGNPQGTYLNIGSCFFLGRKPINRHGILDLMLLSFDFTKEIFTIREELPVCYYDKLVLSGLGEEEEIDIRGAALSYLGDKKVFFRTPRIDFVGGYVFTTDRIINLDFDEGGGYWYYYSMWVLNEQHYSDRLVVYKAKPWTKLHEFGIKTKSKLLYSKPRCVSNDGEFALISTLTDNGRKKLMLFNLVTEKATKDFTIGDRDCRAAYVYKESQVSIMGGGNVLLRWQLPTHGTTYKLNLDAHYTAGRYTNIGIGLCLTSDTGGCIRVRSLRRYGTDVAEGALAMFEAIKWAKELELSPIIIESDSKNMVSFFMEDGDDYNSTCWTSTAGSLLRMARCLLKSSKNSISFQYCSCSCNYVADIAANLGRDETTWSCKDWTANFPGEVVMSLSKDLGLETLR